MMVEMRRPQLRVEFKRTHVYLFSLVRKLYVRLIPCEHTARKQKRLVLLGLRKEVSGRPCVSRGPGALLSAVPVYVHVAVDKARVPVLPSSGFLRDHISLRCCHLV